MSRAMSTTAVKAVSTPQTKEVFLTVLDIYLDGVAEPFHFVNNTEAITRNYNGAPTTYTPLAFSIQLPDEGENISVAKLKLDIVDRIVLEALRGASGANVSFSIILASTPNITESGPFNFILGAFKYDDTALEATLSYGKHLEGRFPKVYKDPFSFPGMF